MQPAAGISALSTETGVRGVIARGGAGALIPELVMGHAVILTGAVRDEGTSFHYLPAGRVVSADPGPAESLADALSAAGVGDDAQPELVDGRHLPRDPGPSLAPGGGRVSGRRDGSVGADGDRPLPLHPVRRSVMAGDSLAGREWQHRGWMTAKSARRQLFASAADAAVALTR